ncbi:MAG TPA: hypothetical protein VGT24_09570 [Candidatus Acidoferrales bacterium]|nr:hypothetical protein [Candidatus Acidoferrales bacterium]
MAESNLQPEQDAQKRRSTRIVQAVPLTVTGVDALGRPFQERTSTLIINCHGCRYQSKHYVLKNMWVTLEVPHNEPGHEPRSVRGRITWIQRPRTVRELFQIGLELEVPGNVWGIAFPPADWFPFPEADRKTTLEVPVPSAPSQAVPEEQKWAAEEAPGARTAQLEENKLRVVPLPASAEASAQLARQMSRLLAEAKLQLQSSARDSATQAVAAETRPLLAALQTQLKDAAEKSAASAISTHIASQQEAQQKLESEREASMKAMLAELSREIEQRISESRLKMDKELAELETARRQEFEQQIQTLVQQATEKLERFSGGLGADESQVRLAVDQLRQTSAQAAAEETRRWQELMDQRAAEAQARLGQMEQAAKKLEDQIETATSIAEARWRGLLEADVATASARWNEKKEASLENAVRQAAGQIDQAAEESVQRIEQQLQQRINAIGDARSQIISEAEGALNALRGATSDEMARGDAVVSQFRQFVEQMESRRTEFSSTMQSLWDAWAQRGEAFLESQTSELNRRADSVVAGVTARLQPVLEASGRETIERLAGEFDQRLAPQMAGATELLNKIEAGREMVEKALADYQQRIWQTSDRGVQEAAARAKEILAQIEKDFGEAARTASARWISDLEAKATETSHSTFESLFKSAEWYEKKVQTQMQSTLEKGMEQANTRLREKAAEMSGIYASELDHYSRSYVEHTRDQMQESSRDVVEQAGRQIADAGNAAGAKFTERAAQLGREQFELYAAKTKDAFEQNASYMEANATQVRVKLESDARRFAMEFQRALSQHAQQTLALGKQELATQIDQAKASLFIQSQGLEQKLQASLSSLGTVAMSEHKQRLENASNSWLLTTVSKLNQQSEGLIKQLADDTDRKLKSVCNNVFAEMGEVLRQRFATLAVPVIATPRTPPASSSSEEKK